MENQPTNQAQALQPVLFDLVLEDDAAILLPAEERQKRYTAEHVAQLERVTNLVLLLLPIYPVETIAREAGISTRTVRALAARESEKVAGSVKECAQVMLRTGLRFLALARTREHEASFKDLMFGSSLAMQHGRELAAMGQGEEEKSANVDADFVQAAADLRRLMTAPPGADQAPADTVSTENGPETPQNRPAGPIEAAQEAAGPARTEPTDPATGPTSATNPDPDRPPGGGAGAPAPADDSMSPSDRGILPKGPLT